MEGSEFEDSVTIDDHRNLVGFVIANVWRRSCRDESQKFSVGDYLEGVIPLFKGASPLQVFVTKGTALQMKKPPKPVSDKDVDEDGDEEGEEYNQESCPFAKFLDERDAKQYDIAPSIFSS